MRKLFKGKSSVGNYLKFSKFYNSKKDSCRGNYMRKHGNLIEVLAKMRIPSEIDPPLKIWKPICAMTILICVKG